MLTCRQLFSGTNLKLPFHVLPSPNLIVLDDHFPFFHPHLLLFLFFPPILFPLLVRVLPLFCPQIVPLCPPPPSPPPLPPFHLISDLTAYFANPTGLTMKGREVDKQREREGGREH